MNISSIVGGIAALAWLVTIGFIALVFVRLGRGRPVRAGGMTVLGLVIVSVLLSIVSSGLVFINPQERGVVISAISSKGVRDQALGPGLHVIVPLAESVVRYPISRETYTMSGVASEGQKTGDDAIVARSADGQQIYIDASVIYAIDPVKAVQVHIQWQNRYAEDLVRPQSRGIIRDVIAQYNVEQVVTSKRGEMVQQVSDALRTKLEENGILMVDFVLRNITFSPEYAASVEQKQIAEQQALQAKQVVEQRKQEAEQARQAAQGVADSAVIKAKGDAEARLIQADAESKALALIAAAIKDNPNLLTYQYINKLSPSIQTMLLPGNAPFVFPLPTMGPAATSETATVAPTAVPTAVPTALPTTQP